MTASAHRCARCGEFLPAAAFRRDPKVAAGLRSWCRSCSLEAGQEWREANPAFLAIDRELKRGVYGSGYFANPMVFSRAVCEHAAVFVGRKIARFEAKTGKEAPPQLVALAEIARQFAEELAPGAEAELDVQKIPKNAPRLAICEGCGGLFESRGQRPVWCSSECESAAYRAKHKHDPEWRRKRREDQVRYQAKKHARDV